MEEQKNKETDEELKKKNAKLKRRVLVGVVVGVAVLLAVAFPLIVIGHGCGLY